MNARTPQYYYLHVAIPGWQGRVDERADVELRDTMTHETVLVLPPALVVQALTHYVSSAKLTAVFLDRVPALGRPRKTMASVPSRAPLRALGVPLRPIRETRRAARASRKPPSATRRA